MHLLGTWNKNVSAVIFYFLQIILVQKEGMEAELNSKSVSFIGIHRPKELDVNKVDFNLGKYKDIPLKDIHLDPRPRIKNIIKELEEEHQWTWPPLPPKDFEKARIMKRKKCPALYNKECLDLCTILSLIIGPWELLVALGFIILPKTFIPAMRESSEFCILFSAIFLIEGAFHIYASILGLGLRSMRPYMIGFAFPSWPFEFVLPSLGLFVTFVGFYTSQRWRILREMTDHLKGYTYHWYSKSFWDRYHSYMHCCGIESYKDWKYHGPILEEAEGNVATVPKSCCFEEDCWKSSTLAESGSHSMGCLDVTLMGTNTIFISGSICMLVALFLSVIGYRSMKEAEDFVGDPCHTLLFDSNSSSFKKSSGALRRDELFSLLNYYVLVLGEELGFDEEVKNVKDYLGQTSNENEQQPPSDDKYKEDKEGGNEVNETEIPEITPQAPEKPPRKSSNLPLDDLKEETEPEQEQKPAEKWDNTMPEELPDPSAPRGYENDDNKSEQIFAPDNVDALSKGHNSFELLLNAIISKSKKDKDVLQEQSIESMELEDNSLKMVGKNSEMKESLSKTTVAREKSRDIKAISLSEVTKRKSSEIQWSLSDIEEETSEAEDNFLQTPHAPLKKVYTDEFNSKELYEATAQTMKSQAKEPEVTVGIAPKQSSLLLSPSVMEFILPREDSNFKKPSQLIQLVEMDNSQSIISLIPEISSIVNNDTNIPIQTSSISTVESNAIVTKAQQLEDILNADTPPQRHHIQEDEIDNNQNSS